MDCTNSKPIEQFEIQSIFPHRREPQKCEHCGFPFGVHRGDCPSLVREKEVRK
jgi:hypothetical protein